MVRLTKKDVKSMRYHIICLYNLVMGAGEGEGLAGFKSAVALLLATLDQAEGKAKTPDAHPAPGSPAPPPAPPARG